MPQKKIKSYTVKFTPDGEGRYIARVPAIPSIVTGASTLTEAIEMASDAIDCHLGYLEKEGIPYNLQAYEK